jgi:hypothetical protein
MSAAGNVKSFAMPAGALACVREAMAALGLNDPKLVTIALARIAVEDLRRDPATAARIRRAYAELAPSAADAPKAPTPKGSSGKPANEPELIPIGRVPGWEPDPAGPPRPYHLLRLYGLEQLPRALARATVDELRVSAREVAERHPGTLPPKKATKSALISYIVEHVGQR